MPDVIREDAFIDTFILPAKRDRYKQLLANPRRRSEFLDRLNHNLDFIPALAQQIPGSQHFAEGVVRLLCKRGMETADTVYIISDSRELDGLSLSLQQAVEQVMAAGSGSIVCCLAGRLAYYRPEEPANGYVLEKPEATKSKSGSAV